MPKYSANVLAAVAVTLAAAFATAVSAHHDARGYGRHHHGGTIVLKPGYSRRGPPVGYRFGFATYRGDPFAHDDYYDGRDCYYRHHRDFCLAFRKPLGLPH